MLKYCSTCTVSERVLILEDVCWDITMRHTSHKSHFQQPRFMNTDELFQQYQPNMNTVVNTKVRHVTRRAWVKRRFVNA